MAEPPRYPAQSDLHTPPISSTTPQSIAALSNQASVVEDSDTEFEPTPIHSPGGPQYDDLPPSYAEAQQQAVHDARSGVAPIDPNQIEAHRLTLSEDPNGPEIWEYRVRGEQQEEEDEPERAPDYVAPTAGPLASTVPIEHVQTSENIPVGRTGNAIPSSSSTSNPIDAMLSAALQFTNLEPDIDVHNAPHLHRPVAIPQEGLTPSTGSARFLRAYAKALNSHSVRPAEFTEFLDGLNALCLATSTSPEELLSLSSSETHQASIRAYIDGANEAYFAPRGLRVSVRSLADLILSLSIPPAGMQPHNSLVAVLDPTNTSLGRAQALYPWIEALDPNVPEPSGRTIALQHMGAGTRDAGRDLEQPLRDETIHEDPPHSIPGEPASTPGNGPFGPPNSGPHGSPGYGPFGPPGYGPFGPPGYGPFGPSSSSPFGPHHRGRGRGSRRGSRGSGGPPQPGNEWATFGKDMGKWGEEFGKRMGQWGQQFGRDMSAMGQQIGRDASTWSQGISAQASGSGGHAPSASNSTAHNDQPPSYAVGQESGVIPRNAEAPPPSSSSPKLDKGKEKTKLGYDDDDSSSTSSDSSDSDSDSDSDYDSDGSIPNSQAIFLKRMHSIDKHAVDSTSKGKKSTAQIAQERASAIAAAQAEKSALDSKIESKMSKRAASKELRRRARELKRAHRQRKQEMRAEHDGKGKGKAKKSRQWKDAKREYKSQKKELRKEKQAARKEWREEKSKRKNERKEGKRTAFGVSEQGDLNGMVWVVVENLQR